MSEPTLLRVLWGNDDNDLFSYEPRPHEMVDPNEPSVRWELVELSPGGSRIWRTDGPAGDNDYVLSEEEFWDVQTEADVRQPEAPLFSITDNSTPVPASISQIKTARALKSMANKYIFGDKSDRIVYSVPEQPMVIKVGRDVWHKMVAHKPGTPDYTYWLSRDYGGYRGSF